MVALFCFQTVKVDEPVDEDDVKEEAPAKDDEAVVEDDKEEKAKTKTVDKTIWDWEVLNDSKPIWTRKYVLLLSYASI